MPGLELATIETLWLDIQRFNDETILAMAAMWRRFGDQILTTGTTLSGHWETLEKSWEGAASEQFGVHSAKASLSMYETTNTAVTNAAMLEMVAAAAGTAQRQMQALWTEYQQKQDDIVAEMESDKPKDGSPGFGQVIANSLKGLFGDSPIEKAQKLRDEYDQRARDIMRPLVDVVDQSTLSHMPEKFNGPLVVDPGTLPTLTLPSISSTTIMFLPPSGVTGGAPPAPGSVAPGAPPAPGSVAPGTPPPAPGTPPSAPVAPPAPGAPGGGAGAQPPVAVPAVPGGTGAPPVPEMTAMPLAPPVPGMPGVPTPGGAGGGAQPAAPVPPNVAMPGMPTAPGGGAPVAPQVPGGVMPGVPTSPGVGGGAPPAPTAPGTGVPVAPPAPGGAASGAIPLRPGMPAPALPGARLPGMALTAPPIRGIGGGTGGRNTTPPSSPGLGRGGASLPLFPGGGATSPASRRKPGRPTDPPSGQDTPTMFGFPPLSQGPGRQPDDQTPPPPGSSRLTGEYFDTHAGRPTEVDLAGRHGPNGPTIPPSMLSPALDGRRGTTPPPDGPERRRNTPATGWNEEFWSIGGSPRPDLTGRKPAARPALSPPSLPGARDRGLACGQSGAPERRPSVKRREEATPVAPEEVLWALPSAPPAPVDEPAPEDPPPVPTVALPGKD
jgi:hypothetical protein